MNESRLKCVACNRKKLNRKMTKVSLIVLIIWSSFCFVCFCSYLFCSQLSIKILELPESIRNTFQCLDATASVCSDCKQLMYNDNRTKSSSVTPKRIKRIVLDSSPGSPAARSISHQVEWDVSEWNWPIGHPWQGQSVDEVMQGMQVSAPHTWTMLCSVKDSNTPIMCLREIGELMIVKEAEDIIPISRIALQQEVDDLVTKMPSSESILDEDGLRVVQSLKNDFVKGSRFQHLSTLFQLIAVPARVHRNTRDTAKVKMGRAFFPLLFLLNIRSQHFTGIATVLSLYLWSCGLTERAIGLLAHIGAGVCATTIRRFADKRVKDAYAIAEEMLEEKDETTFYVCDNLEFNVKSFHSSASKPDSLLHFTTLCRFIARKPTPSQIVAMRVPIPIEVASADTIFRMKDSAYAFLSQAMR